MTILSENMERMIKNVDQFVYIQRTGEYPHKLKFSVMSFLYALKTVMPSRVNDLSLCYTLVLSIYMITERQQPTEPSDMFRYH